MNIKKELSYSMSGRDILTLMRYKCNLMTFTELMNKPLNEILGKYGACVILYETLAENVGHWCLLFEVKPNLIEVFDPYGKMINETLKYMNPIIKRRYNVDGRKFIKKLVNSDYRYIEYNNYPFQTHKKGISTCGRHVCVRLMNRGKTLDEYYEWINSFDKDYDILVCELTPRYTKT